MTSGPDGRDELLRRFEAAVAGAELDDLRRLAGDLASLVGPAPTPRPRPNLRRPPRSEAVRYRLRVDLDHAAPPIWRRLDVRSDIGLDVVHQVLQAAFSWTDSHLHRFSLGGGPFDGDSELFLCPFDVEEGEDDGVPAGTVRLDETLQEPGDVLHYLYDYGDSWALTLRLEQVLPIEDAGTAAVCVDGRRAAPPEDCGGITTGEELAEVLDDPAHFDVAEVNRALQEPFFVLRELGLHPRLVDLVNRLRFTDVGDDLVTRALGIVTPGPELTRDEKAAALAAFQWFLDRAADGGIELTSAGYLKPADVLAVSDVLPAMADWIGANNREVHTYPVLEFRQSMQAMGLLRKRKGRLLLTRAGAAASRDPEVLWRYLAIRLAPSGDRSFADDAGLLLLAQAATSPGVPLALEPVTAALGELGWRRGDGRSIHPRELLWIDGCPLDVLRNVADPAAPRRDRAWVSPAAASLARAALLAGG